MVPCVKVHALRHSQSEPAPAESKIGHLIKGAAHLHDGILADNTDVADAIFNIGRHISRLGEHYLHIRIRDRQNQPPSLLTDRRTVVAETLEHRNAVLFKPALCQGDSDRLHHARPSRCIFTRSTTSMSSSTT